jgi:hypothetical protein
MKYQKGEIDIIWGLVLLATVFIVMLSFSNMYDNRLAHESYQKCLEAKQKVADVQCVPPGYDYYKGNK